MYECFAFVYVCTHMCSWWLRRSHECLGSPRTGVTVSCESVTIGLLGIELVSSTRAASNNKLSWKALSSACRMYLKRFNWWRNAVWRGFSVTGWRDCSEFVLLPTYYMTLSCKQGSWCLRTPKVDLWLHLHTYTHTAGQHVRIFCMISIFSHKIIHICCIVNNSFFKCIF